MGNGSLHGGEMSIRKKMGDRLWAISDRKSGIRSKTSQAVMQEGR
jgi:hypothetical protein